MQIMDVLRRAQGGRAIENLSAAFGVEPEQSDAVVALVVGELAQRLERITLSRGGLADLVKALGDPRHRRALGDPSVFEDPAIGEDGNAILGHIVGTKDASRGIAARAADASGLDETTIKRMLPYVAAFAMSGIAASLTDRLGESGVPVPGHRSPTGDGGEPSEGPRGQGSWPSAADPAVASPSASTVGRPSGAAPPGGFALPPPVDGRSYAPQPVGSEERPSWPRSSPAPSGTPWPAGNSPLGADRPRAPSPGGGPLTPPGGGSLDDISDAVRRGGQSPDGNPLGGLVRSILGGLLGFQSRGIMGWIVRLIFVRFGWSILKRIIGRALTGR